MREIRELIIHCTGTSPAATLQSIRNYHTKTLGWNDIGYHFIVDRNGYIWNGRPIEQAGAHCIGHNAHSVGIAYIGGLDGKDTRTQFQKNALQDFVYWFRLFFPTAKVYGHNEFANKACPCFNVRQEFGIDN